MIIEIVNAFDERAEFQVPPHAARGLEVLGDAFAEVAGFADVDDGAETVAHEVDAGLVREVAKLFLDVVGQRHASNKLQVEGCRLQVAHALVRVECHGMKTRSVFLWSSMVSLGTVQGATVINFDDLSPGSSWLVIPSGYEGLLWNNFGVLDGSSRGVLDGYGHGTVSPRNVVFNLSGDPASIVSGAPFDLNSVYMTSQVGSNEQVRVQGLLGTNVLYDNIYTVNPNAPALVTFNYLGIDHVNFNAGGNVFVLDDLKVTIASPGPAASFQNVEVPAIAHKFFPPNPARGGGVTDFLVNQSLIPAVGRLQSTRLNFDTNNQYALTISAPAGKRFLIHPRGQSAHFGGEAIWELSGVNVGGGPTGSMTATFHGLSGTPPDFSPSRSFLLDYHGSFGFSTLASTPFTNDFSFRSITFSATFYSVYTNSGTLNYLPDNSSSFQLLTITSQTNDPGPFIFIVDQPTLALRGQLNGDVTLTFTGTLQSANSVYGPYKDVPGNPAGTYTVPRASLVAQQYFRTRDN